MIDYEGPLNALIRCRELLQASKESFWAGLPLAQIIDEIDRTIAQLKDGESIDKKRLEQLFAPTGSIQDISVDNGWGDEFLDLAAKVDRLTAG
ncbi:MAG: hypothetical protein ACIAXF_16825 [Phycisphaerales bacterium JB063]